MWFGKAAGAALGLVSGGVFGSVVGLWAGHLLDKFMTGGAVQKLNASQIQNLFFRTTFRAMGRLAKADGRVTESEIAAASLVMDQMHLHGSARQAAIDCFTQGKNSQFNLDDDLRSLRSVFAVQPNLAVLFFEIQLSVAYADGDLSKAERHWLDELREALGLNHRQLEQIHQRVAAALAGRFKEEQDSALQLRNAYKVLGVAENCDALELKKTYRKLMSQHHPDKLVAKGLPEEMMTLAKEKTQQIQTAYDLILKARAR